MRWRRPRHRGARRHADELDDGRDGSRRTSAPALCARAVHLADLHHGLAKAIMIDQVCAFNPQPLPRRSPSLPASRAPTEIMAATRQRPRVHRVARCDEHSIGIPARFDYCRRGGRKADSAPRRLATRTLPPAKPRPVTREDSKDLASLLMESPLLIGIRRDQSRRRGPRPGGVTPRRCTTRARSAG